MRGEGRRNPAIVRLAGVAGAVAVSGLLGIALSAARPDPDRLRLAIREDWEAGRLDRAEAGMRRLVALRPPTDDDWMVLGQIAMARGRLAEAGEALARVSDGAPASARARAWEGQMELRLHRARGAEDALLRAVRLAPDDPAPRRDLVLLYCMQRRRRELSEQFAALAGLEPLDFHQMMLWSSSLASSWDPSEAAPVLEEFVAADPDDRLSRLTLAEAYRRLDRVDDARTTLGPLPTADPEVRAILARIALARGDISEVERLTGDDADRHPVLARMRAQLDLNRRDLRSATRHLRAAAALDPHNRAVLFQLGDTLLRLGEVEEGRRYLSSSKDHDELFALLVRFGEPGSPNDARLMSQVAVASLRVGLREQARNWYLVALRLDPTNDEVQKALYRLDHEGAVSLAGAQRPTVSDPRPPGRAGEMVP
jgi:predicted Zn-dependent protease